MISECLPHLGRNESTLELFLYNEYAEACCSYVRHNKCDIFARKGTRKRARCDLDLGNVREPSFDGSLDRAPLAGALKNRPIRLHARDLEGGDYVWQGLEDQDTHGQQVPAPTPHA